MRSGRNNPPFGGMQDQPSGPLRKHVAQIFPHWSNRLPSFLGGGLLLLGAVMGLTVGYYFSPEFTDVGYRPHQPLPFSHRLHAGELKIDCRYCHATVEVSAVASVPPTQVCMNCHELVGGDAAELALLKESAATGFPIQWVRVHKIPEYAYFDHSVHVRTGIGCATCHGDVTQMEEIMQSEPLSMGWCLDCHRTMKTSKSDPPTDCSRCHR